MFASSRDMCSQNRWLIDNLRKMFPSGGGTKLKMRILLLQLPKIQPKANKFLIVTVAEVIDFCYFGTDLPSQIISMIVCPFAFGVRQFVNRQEKLYSRDTWHKKIGNAVFRLETIDSHIVNYQNSLDSNFLSWITIWLVFYVFSSYYPLLSTNTKPLIKISSPSVTYLCKSQYLQTTYRS